MKTEAAREVEAQSLFDNDSEEEGEEHLKAKVFEEDLVRFIPWDDGESSIVHLLIELTKLMIDENDLSIKNQAEIGILLQQPWNKDPVNLAKVLHLKLFIKWVAVKKVILDLSEEMQDEALGDGSEMT